MACWLNRCLLIALLLGVAGITPARAQLNWRSFNRDADGLAARYPTYLSFSPKGNLWIRHKDEPYLTQLDGYEGREIMGPMETTAAVPLASRVYESVTGQLWTLHPEGVQWREGDTWMVGKVPEIRAEMESQILRAVRPVPLLPAEYNNVLILLSDRLLKFEVHTQRSQLIRDSGSVGLGRFSDFLSATAGGLWITAENGIARVAGAQRRLDLTEAVWEMHQIPAELGARNPQRPIEDGAGGLLMLAERRVDAARIWLHFHEGEWMVRPLPRGSRGAWLTRDGRAWGLETTGLYQWLPPDQETRDMDDLGIQPYGFSDVAIESGGAFWVSTPEGVWRYAPFSWSPPSDTPALDEPVHDIHEAADGALWFLSAGGLLRREADQWRKFEFPSAIKLTNSHRIALGEFADGRVFFSDGFEVLSCDPETGEFWRFTAPGGGRAHFVGSTAQGHLFAVADDQSGGQRLLHFDGVAWAPPSFEQPPDSLGAWTTLLATTTGEVWLGGDRGVARLAADGWTVFSAAQGLIPDGVTAFFERGGGTMWAATSDKLLAFSNQNWVELRTGLDRVTSVTASRDGTIWMTTEGGLFRQVDSQWVGLGPEEGVPGGVQVLRETSDGRLWLGHARGLSLFHPEADADPPQTYLVDTPRSVLFAGDEMISFVFAGRDRWKATPVERLLFSYRIDDGPWLPPSAATRVTFPANSLQPGSHKFEVRAMDRHLNVDTSPAAWAFTIVVPWFKEPRVVGIVLLAAAAVLVFAGLAVNRHLRLVRSYAEIERIVAERTRQLEVANRELAHAEKMRSLGTLAAGVAHDFNSILSIIRGSVQIIEAHPRNEEKVRTRISRIKSMVEQGSTLVKSMLGFSRADDAALVLEDVGAVVGDTVRLLGDRLPPEVEVVLDVMPGLPAVRGTRELLQQMLLNLILNAVDAMEGRGRLVLHGHRLSQVPEHWVLAPAPAAEYVGITVEDSGSGISPENLSRVFEPFFTTKAFSTRHGTGLGLSMVYEFCKELGYGLQVRSELGKGTVFSIVIPVL